MAEEHEKETSAAEEEVWVEQASQLPPFLAGFLVTLEDYAGVSFEYLYLQAHFVMERVD